MNGQTTEDLIQCLNTKSLDQTFLIIYKKQYSTNHYVKSCTIRSTLTELGTILELRSFLGKNLLFQRVTVFL